MKIPFRSRGDNHGPGDGPFVVDDFDNVDQHGFGRQDFDQPDEPEADFPFATFDGAHPSDLAKRAVAVRPDEDAEEHEQEHDFSHRPAPASRSERVLSASSTPMVAAETAETAAIDVSADDFVDEMQRLQTDAPSEQRSAWAYLGLLSSVFTLLVIFGYGCSDQRGSEPANGGEGELVATGRPVRLEFRIEGDIVTLQGVVPDEGAKGQLLSRVQEPYGSENVIDELVVDDNTSFDEGTIRIVGSATFGDERPQMLHEVVGRDFGLANRGFEVGFVEMVLAATNASVTIAEDTVILSGVVPDEQSVADLTAMATEVWGAGNVDVVGLTVGQTTWTDGVLRVTGSALSNDERQDAFIAMVPERIGTLVVVDSTGLVINDITEQLNNVQAAIDQARLANPISFAPLSAEIDPASDPTLVDVATLVGQLPSIPFEVVGHTDSSGNDQDNLLLSEDRAKAVVARLIELGVPAERVTARGEGESKPVGDNDTADGRAANRRIEFTLVGTSGQ